MFVLASQLHKLPVISLQTGREFAVTRDLIINPDDLSLLAVRCDIDRGGKRTRILLIQDIRQLSFQGVLVDSEDELSEEEDLVRLQDVLNRHCSIIGVTVETEGGQRLGKPDDFTIDLEDSKVKKIYVRQTIVRSILNNSLIIDREQIVDVTPEKIIVRDTRITSPLLAPSTPPTP